MKAILGSAAAVALSVGSAHAGGLDRSGQSVSALFEPGGVRGGYAEASLAYTEPALSGTAEAVPATPPFLPGSAAGFDYEGVGGDFLNPGAAIKIRFTEALSGALIYEQPFGSDLLYNGDPTTTSLGGTLADATTNSLTALLRYSFTDRWSVHGGLRIQEAEGQITLSGQAYSWVNGYHVDLAADTSVGYVLGAAYEIPQIALRVALTYNSAITQQMDTVESGPAIPALVPGQGLVMTTPLDGDSVTDVTTPQSVNLDFQTGIAPDTLLFGTIRWVEWSEFRIDPELFLAVTGVGLVELYDTTTFTLGLGHQVTDRFAASVAASYEASGDGVVSPLSPHSGFFALALGAAYDFGRFEVSGGVRHAWLGDTEPSTGTPPVVRAVFDNNSATTVALRVAYTF